jgi:hypothetical protein
MTTGRSSSPTPTPYAAAPTGPARQVLTRPPGFSGNLSFDEAAQALANLPPLDLGGTADALVRVQVVEIGGVLGGIAGFNNLFVRVCRTHD